MMSGAGASKPTIAEQIRTEEAKETVAVNKTSFALEAMAAMPTLKPCKFRGGTPRRMQAVRNAHNNGYELALDVIGKIEQNNIYQRWFGGFKKSHISKIKSDFTKIKNDFEHQTFTYDLTGDGCDKGDYAFTYPSTKRISLCSSFWMAHANGADSKAGTIVHEHSHHSAGTDDNAYGEADCKRLAKFNSNKAVRNADSHEFFVGG
jgi:peptidyl-Lys metalloendopeptidase